MKKLSYPLLALVATSLMSFKAIATAGFQVDSLLKIGNESGHGIFTVTNPTQHELFLSAQVEKVEVVDGKITKTALTRDNFPMWDLAINPSKVRMLPGEVKDFAVRYLCTESCPREEDLVYQIRFKPAIVNEMEGQSVDILFGMAPYYIVPTSSPNIDFELNFDEEAQVMSVHNTGNTYLKVEVDNCQKFEDKGTQSCRAMYSLLAGRSNEFKLSDRLISDNTEVRVYNYDQSYEKLLSL